MKLSPNAKSLSLILPKTKTKRSRANPMFVRKINKGHVTNLEPSSPKVTCTGQVKRSNNEQTITVATVVGRRRNWFRRLKTRWFRRLRRRKFLFFRFNCCRSSGKLQESKRIEASKIDDELNSELATRNANLLMRCKSGPYRSSSLANKIMETRRREEEEGDGEVTVTEVVEITEGVNEETGCINGVNGKPVSLSRCKSVSATRQELEMSFLRM